MGRALRRRGARTMNPLLGTGKAGPAVRVADPGDRERPHGHRARPRRRRHQGGVIATDLCVLSMAEAGRLRAGVAEALGVPGRTSC